MSNNHFSDLFLSGLMMAICSVVISYGLMGFGFLLIPGIVFAIATLSTWKEMIHRKINYSFFWIFFVILAYIVNIIISQNLSDILYPSASISAQLFMEHPKLNYLSGMIGAFAGTLIIMVAFVFLSNFNGIKIKTSEFLIGLVLGAILIQTSFFALYIFDSYENPILQYASVYPDDYTPGSGGSYPTKEILFIDSMPWATSAIVFWQIGMAMYLSQLILKNNEVKNGKNEKTK